MTKSIQRHCIKGLHSMQNCGSKADFLYVSAGKALAMARLWYKKKWKGVKEKKGKAKSKATFRKGL